MKRTVEINLYEYVSVWILTCGLFVAVCMSRDTLGQLTHTSVFRDCQIFTDTLCQATHTPQHFVNVGYLPIHYVRRHTHLSISWMSDIYRYIMSADTHLSISWLSDIYRYIMSADTHTSAFRDFQIFTDTLCQPTHTHLSISWLSDV